MKHEKYSLLSEKDMFTKRDQNYVETDKDSKIKAPSYKELVNANLRNYEPLNEKDKGHEKLRTKFIGEKYDPIKSGNRNASEVPHDRASVRAANSKYDPFTRENVSNPNSTVFVHSLPAKTRKDDLYKYFGGYGPIRSIALPQCPMTKVLRGYAFVEFENIKDALVAFKEAHQTKLLGKEIFVDFMRAKAQDGWVPRREGGGVGGKKESGQMRFGGRDLAHQREERRGEKRREERRDYRREGRREEERRERNRSPEREEEWERREERTIERREERRRDEKASDRRSSSPRRDERRYEREDRESERREDKRRDYEGRGERYERREDRFQDERSFVQKQLPRGATFVTTPITNERSPSQLVFGQTQGIQDIFGRYSEVSHNSHRQPNRNDSFYDHLLDQSFDVSHRQSFGEGNYKRPRTERHNK